jgi:hypothetical protein
MSKLSDFLKQSKLDPRRVVSTSKDIERKRPEDRPIHLARHVVKKGKPTDADKELATKKPRSGKPITTPQLARALNGEVVAGPAKTRILRAVNKLLESKKKSAVTLKDLF